MSKQSTIQRSRRVPPQVDTAPLAYDSSSAATALGKSTSWLRLMRHQDMARQEAGQPPLGPPWRTLNGSIVYLRAELERWLLQRSEVRGRLAFRGHPDAP